MNVTQVANKMIEKNAARAEALQSFQGRRTYRLDYTGFPTSLHAEMVVDMTYDAPNTKKFKIISQSGPDWLVDRVLKKLIEVEADAQTEENRERVALNTTNYEFTAFENQNSPDGCSYMLSVEPKTPNKLLYRGRIWLDSKDFAVCRIEAEPSKNPSFWIKKTDIHHSYMKVGDFWLPAENQSTSLVRGGGHAVLTIKYQNYEILAARAVKGTDVGPSASSNALPNRSE